MKQLLLTRATTILVTITLLIMAPLSLNAQDSLGRRCIFWAEPYRHSIGLTYGYSKTAGGVKGIEYRCRWFGIGAEVNNGFRMIDINGSEIADLYRSEASLYQLENIKVYGFSQHYFMLSVSGHFRYFSIGVGWGANEWNFVSDGWVSAFNIEVHTPIGRSLQMTHYWLRPFVEGHIPLLNNKIILSPKIGYNISLHYKEIEAFKLNNDLYYGIGLSKTF